MTVLFLALAGAGAYLGFEALRHRRALQAIPIRIHVNGSRGKSSVTRLLAAALRESGLRTLAKTTGSRARLILPDGREEPVIRLGTPNVSEQFGILDRARREKVEVMVMECMAVRPDLQRFTEGRIMRSSIGVITNVRPDHMDVMGPTLEDVAASLAATIPCRGVAVLGERRYAELMQAVAEERGSRLILADVRELPQDAMGGFRYLEHDENVATVLAVTRHLRIPDETALKGMYKAEPDAGACTRWILTCKGREIELLNAFAANDIESTIALWRRLGLDTPGAGPTVALLNLRGDRLDRSLQFAEAVERQIRADYYLLVGDVPGIILRRFARQVPPERLRALRRVGPEEIFDQIAELSPHRTRVGGIGNIAGIGHEILSYAAARAGDGEPAC